MKRLFFLNKYREKHASGDLGDEYNGVFQIPHPFSKKDTVTIVASNGLGWDHVSISLPYRCPTWDEMAHFKHLFFEKSDCVIQYHVPTEDHISVHPFCLHLWRPQREKIPTPPKYLVG